MAETTETVPEVRESRRGQAAPLPAGDRDLRPRRMRLSSRRFRLALLIAGIGVLVAVVFLWRYFSSYQSTDDAQIDGHLSPVSARISGHVEKLLVNDNQYVQAGTPLLEIDPKDYEVAVEKARADYQDALATAQAAQVNVPITSVSTASQVAAAQADVESARAGISAAAHQYAAAQAQIAEAEANNVKAQADLERYRQLVAKQEISQQQYDQIVASAKASAATLEAGRASADAAQQQVSQARAKLGQAEAALRSAGTAPQQVAATRSRAQSATANVQRAKAVLDQAELNLQYTHIVAPVTGIVTNRRVEVGQNVQPGQELLKVIPLDDIWVTANFKETELRDMKYGQRATISVDAYDKDYAGHVDSVAGASGAMMSLLPPENATGNYVKVVQRVPVKIVFEPGETREHILRPGMNVVVKVWLR